MKKQLEYLEHIEDHIIFNCIVAKKFIGLLTREPQKELSKVVNTKLIIINFDGDFQGCYNFKDFVDIKGCVVRDPENPGLILTSSNGQVYFYGFVGDTINNSNLGGTSGDYKGWSGDYVTTPVIENW